MTQKITAITITFLFLIAALWWFGGSQPSMSTNESNNQSPTAMSWSSAPDMTLDTNQSYQAVIKTDAGDMTFNLFVKEVPQTVNNFVFLSKQNFYNQTFFHRIVKNFMIQGGDPEGTGRGGPGYTFPDEPVNRSYERGVLAMANSGPDTNGSQFFIMHQDVPLPPNYTIFGKLVAGFDVLDTIADTPVTDNGAGENSKPLTKTYIRQIDISME